MLAAAVLIRSPVPPLIAPLIHPLVTQGNKLPAAKKLAAQALAGDSLSVTTERKVHWLIVVAVLVGAMLPDVTLYFMWGWAKSQGIAERVIWDELYFSPYWQGWGAMTNSAPLMLSMMVLAWVAGGGLPHRRARTLSGQALSKTSHNPQRQMLANCVWVLSVAALLHIATDFPLHHDDGHPHFWPVSDWIFSSPVSYWDSQHFSGIWIPVELVLACICCALLWRRFAVRIWVKLVLMLGMSSYAVMAVYWLLAFS